MISLEDQIKCVEREIALRKRVYPRWIAAGKMTNEKANDEIARMQAVRESLITLDELDNNQE